MNVLDLEISCVSLLRTQICLSTLEVSVGGSHDERKSRDFGAIFTSLESVLCLPVGATDSGIIHKSSGHWLKNRICILIFSYALHECDL